MPAADPLAGFISAVSVPSSHTRLFEAFDLAWAELVSVAGGTPTADATMRRQLATAVLRASENRADTRAIAQEALREVGVS